MFCSRFVHHHCHHRPWSVLTRNPTKNWSQDDLLPSNQTRYIFVSSLSISISPLSQSKSSKTKIIIRGQLANNRPKRNWCHDGHPPLCWIWSSGHFFETVLLSNKKDAKREICFCFSLNHFQSVGLFLLLDSNFVSCYRIQRTKHSEILPKTQKMPKVQTENYLKKLNTGSCWRSKWNLYRKKINKNL